MAEFSEDVPGGIVLLPGTPYAKELAKFEQFATPYTGKAGPGNPYQYRPFPKMVYRAQHYRGKVVCGAQPGRPSEYANAQEYGQAVTDAEAFSASCQRIVNDEVELSRAIEDGWRESPGEAVEFVLERDKAASTAAAERNYRDRNMSEAALREAAEAEAETHEHLPEIPEKRKRGRPRKDAA